VDLRFGAPVTAVEDLGDRVRATAGDSSVEADILLGADGIHSAVRRLVFGDDGRFLRFLGFHTAAFVFADPEIHAAVGDRCCLTDTIGRQMGFYGLRDGKVAAFAVHRTDDPAQPGDARAALRAEYGSWAGWCHAPSAGARPPRPCTTTRSPRSRCRAGTGAGSHSSAIPVTPSH
jgi:2-polyprenyl-6-methoxyphenol hydroxylase-like FAD-dependent oxidoreductase